MDLGRWPRRQAGGRHQALAYGIRKQRIGHSAAPRRFRRAKLYSLSRFLSSLIPTARLIANQPPIATNARMACGHPIGRRSAQPPRLTSVKG